MTEATKGSGAQSRLDALRLEIKQQRAVRTLGYMGFGIEVPCDELEALIEIAQGAEDYEMNWSRSFEVSESLDDVRRGIYRFREVTEPREQEPAGGAIDRMQRRALLADDDPKGTSER